MKFESAISGSIILAVCQWKGGGAKILQIKYLYLVFLFKKIENSTKLLSPSILTLQENLAIPLFLVFLFKKIENSTKLSPLSLPLLKKNFCPPPTCHIRQLVIN